MSWAIIASHRALAEGLQVSTILRPNRETLLSTVTAPGTLTSRTPCSLPKTKAHRRRQSPEDHADLQQPSCRLHPLLYLIKSPKRTTAREICGLAVLPPPDEHHRNTDSTKCLPPSSLRSMTWTRPPPPMSAMRSHRFVRLPVRHSSRPLSQKKSQASFEKYLADLPRM